MFSVSYLTNQSVLLLSLGGRMEWGVQRGACGWLWFGSLRSKLLSDKGQEYWFSRVLIKIHMIWKWTGRHWDSPPVMKREASFPWLLLDEKAHHLHINHRDLSKSCQNFPQATLLDFFQHLNNYSMKSPEFHAIKKGRNYSDLEIFSG